MFDLFRSREKNVRWLLGILLGVVALSMVVTLVPNYSGLSRGASVDQTTIAEIGEETVTTAQVRQLLTQATRSGMIPHGLESVYAPHFVQQLIAERAIAHEARRLGMSVSEDQLATEIQAQIPQLFQGGKFAGAEIYATYLQQINKTIPEFESDLRNFIFSQVLESLVLEGIVVTPAQLEAEFRKHNEKIRVSYFHLTPDKLKVQVSMSPEELQAYFKVNRQSYTIPEKRDLLYFLIDEAKVAAGSVVPESELRRAYDQQRERFRIPARAHVVHILLKTADKSPSDVQALRKRMDEVLKQARGGADFAALARKNSEDTVSAAKGGDIGWITRGQTVPEFEKAAFSLKPGQISDVITTTYGFHILRVEQRQEAHMQTFDEVRNDLQKELSQSIVIDKMQTLGDQLHTALTHSAADAEKLAAANGIRALRAEKAGPGDVLPEIGASQPFNDAISGLPKGGVTQPFSLTPTQLVVAQVANIYPQRPAELAEVREQVQRALLQQKTIRLLGEKAQAIEHQLESGQEFAAVAKSLGAEVKTTSTPFGRDGAVEGLGPARQIEVAFTKRVGEFLGPVNLPDGTFFFKVAEKIEPDMSQFPAQRERILKSVKGAIADDRRELFMDGLVDAMSKAKIIKIHEDNIKRMLAVYGS
ncbi:MAG: peptidylprolyl isomerase [Bryobacteraceae bacterium]